MNKSTDWYAVVRIPKELRSVRGLKFRQSLKTHVRSEAQLRALPLIARLKQEMKKAHGQFAPDTDEAWVLARCIRL